MTGYLMTFQGKVFATDGKVEMTEAEAQEHNTKLSAAEIEAFAKAGEGARWFAYLSSDGKRITNFMGAELGTVFSKKTARVGFRDCTGRRPERHFLTVRDTQGRFWKGTSPGPGMYARLRLS